MTDNGIVEAYSQSGGDLPYFVGKQYGSGWLRTIARVGFPILKHVGRIALRTAKDVLNKNKGFIPSIRDNTVSEVRQMVNPRKRGRKKDILDGSGLNKF